MTPDHTDTTANGGLPLSQPWERVAAKDLQDIGHHLTHGLFMNPADFADRLRQTADGIEEWAAENPESFPMLSGATLGVLGCHVAAVTIAAQAIARLTDGDPGLVSADLLRKGRQYYDALSPERLEELTGNILLRLEDV